MSINLVQSSSRQHLSMLVDQFKGELAVLYRFIPKNGKLQLFLQTSEKTNIPIILDPKDALLEGILQSSNPFSDDRRKFGECFSLFQSKFLWISPLQFKNKMIGLLVLGQKKMASLKEMEIFALEASHLSYFLATLQLEEEKEEFLKSQVHLEQKLESAYQRIIESDKLASLGRFASGVAHELNTPLGAIQASAEYLQLFVKGQTEQESLGWILKAVAHSRDIVENVLRLSRDGARDLEPVALKNVIEDAVYLTAMEMEKKGIRIEFQLEANPVVLGNHTRLVQVVTNLLTNAKDSIVRSRFIPQKGFIQILLGHQNNMALLQIEDNGSGISQKILGQVFDPFFTTKEIGQGIGLGLSICHAIVEEHQGLIEITSQEGKGTKVFVKIPVRRMACSES